MTTKVTDKGIIYPDGTEQTTAAFGSGGGSVDAYTKEETDDKFYDKEEINNLLEASSGAIVGNYKANYPNSVARDPEAGNLYLVNIMSFTNNYDEVTSLYISKTDADGTERDLSQIVNGDIIDLESANGSGSYIIQSSSDSGAYYEILVDRGDCNGTLAQDDSVTAILEVASVGGSGSLPKGSIIMWSDPTVPEGWQICDGTNDTPDLRDKFVVGAGNTYDLDATGGSKDAIAASHTHTASTNSTGAHTHTLSGSTNTTGNHTHTIAINATSSNGSGCYSSNFGSGIATKASTTAGNHSHSLSGTAASAGAHTHTITVASAGESGTDKNLPPYYAIYYIIKMVDGGGSIGGGIEEAPIDGKQYARQDETWTEVEASGGGEAQPPVAFELGLSVPQTNFTSGDSVKIAFDKADVDTESGLNATNNSYVVKKSGLYNLHAQTAGTNNPSKTLKRAILKLFVNGVEVSAMNSDKGDVSTVNLVQPIQVTTVVDLKVNDEITVELDMQYSTGNGSIAERYTSLSGHMVSSFTEGSGGGDYTPEKLVWEDKKADRAYDVEYTNTNDVPLYLSVNTKSNSSGTGRINLTVDGVQMLTVGASAGGTTANVLDSVFTVVPAGSTYIIKAFDSPELTNWFEARMPVAVGTGGKTVAFKATMTTAGFTLDGGIYKVVPFNTTEFDSENSFDVDNHGYVVPESGIYNFTTYAQTIAAGAYHAGLFVNGSAAAYGSNVGSRTLGTNDSYILDLKEGDIVDYRLLADTGTVINQAPSLCFFSGFKISGGSASGGSTKHESGTYIPKYYGSTSMTELNIASYQRQEGAYERDGQMVTVTVDIGTADSTGVGTGNGSLLVTLPFTAASDIINTSGVVGYCKRFGAENQPRTVLVSKDEAFAKPYRVDYNTEELDERVSADIQPFDTGEYNRMIFTVTYRIAEGE